MADATSNTLTVNTDIWFDSAAAPDLLGKISKQLFGGDPLVFTAVENDGETMVQMSLRQTPQRQVPDEQRLKVIYFIIGYKSALGWD